MAFTPLQTILQERRATSPSLQAAARFQELRAAWAHILPRLFPKLAAHFRRTIAVAAYRKDAVVLEGKDASSVSLLTLRRGDIAEAFRRAAPDIPIRSIVIRLR